MSIARLVIHPADPRFRPAQRELLVDALADLGFIGAALPASDDQLRYLIGEQFLNFVTFLGCSPAIEIEPPADGSEDFCHVVISPLHERPQFCSDAAGKGPRCPACRHEETNWQTLAKQYQQNPSLSYTCPQCQQATPLMELNWRKAAVPAHIFISIYSVFPNEAVLADKVLQVLEQSTGSRWQYFYHR